MSADTITELEIEPRIARMGARVYKDQQGVGRAIGRILGHKGHQGGWIYYHNSNKTVCQGWASYAHVMLGTNLAGNYDRQARGYRLVESDLATIQRRLDHLRARGLM